MDLIQLEERDNCSDTITSVLIKLIEEERFTKSWIFDDRTREIFKGIGRMFYIIDPTETTFKEPEQVPKFFRNAWPYFVVFILLENLILWLDRKPTFRLNDGLTSLSHGLVQECGRLIFRGGESYAYVYLYENFRLFELSWDKPLTWYLAGIGVDFCYYWVHRACHEVHILWAQHQVHHSSEEFNLAVGLRQSVVQGWCGFIFYLPLAFAIPPSHFITHQQFNLLYQFWIHTKTVKTLGPLEFIFNTPQHHRVHHGANIYCLDKNYGGVLIIWDRIFGTFSGERKDEEIVYGLVLNQPSFDILHLQTFYTLYVVEKFKQMNCWQHKLAAVFFGPSWQPGKPRLGLDEDKIKVVAREKYDVKLPLWCNVYLLIHFCVVVYGFQELASRHMVGLSRLKESVAPSDSDKTPDTRSSLDYYPFAMVFRLRVLQIVCGISFLVIGTVAFIEEKGRMNLGLGIPAGGATILAAAASIHTTKGFGGYRTSTCMPGSHLRFLGPSVKIAIPLTILWATACSFLAILMLQSTKVLSCYQDNVCINEVDPFEDENDLLILASVELLLAIVTFLAVFMLLRIDCKYDPD